MTSSHYVKSYSLFIDGMQMYYRVQGEGEPLLLLHGFMGSGADWVDIGAPLAKDFRLIIPDLRGHGQSTNPHSNYTFRQVASDLYVLLDHLGIKQCKGIGCSGGGNALLHMALRQPDRLQAMVLVSATSHYPEQARVIMRQATADALTQEQWQALRERHVYGDGQIFKLYEHARAFAENYQDMSFTSKELATITAQTLLVQGDRDFLYPIEISIDMYRAISQASLWIIPNGGHIPITNDIDGFIRIATQFLKK